MRILMLCYEFPPLGGGGSRAVHGLSRELVHLGHGVDVVTMAFRGLPRNEDVDGVRVHRVPCVRLKEYACTIPEAATYLLFSMPKIKQLLRRNTYDIIHSHFILPDGLLAWRINRVTEFAYIITAHGSDVPGYNPDRLKLAHRVLAPLWKTVVRNAACMVCPGRSLQSLVAARMPGLSTDVIPYGFEAGRYDPHVERRKRILVVTRMVQRKGVQFLLQALATLELEHEVHIVGDGPYLATLRKLAADNGINAAFHGWLDNRSTELNTLYETSEIFVLASEAENFPVALLEAMAAGLAIITTKGTGCAEVVGHAAILVDPRNPDQLRTALVTLTNDANLCRKLGLAAKKRVEELFSWSVVTKRYLRLYKRFGARRNSAAGRSP